MVENPLSYSQFRRITSKAQKIPFRNNRISSLYTHPSAPPLFKIRFVRNISEHNIVIIIIIMPHLRTISKRDGRLYKKNNLYSPANNINDGSNVSEGERRKGYSRWVFFPTLSARPPVSNGPLKHTPRRHPFKIALRSARPMENAATPPPLSGIDRTGRTSTL